jgi:HEPN domain-containing protein
MKETTRRWLRTAENDLEMAGIALEHEFFDQCVFHCQQSIEKLLKAMWIEWLEKPHPKTHGLRALAQALPLELSDERRNFLERLGNQYLPSHYADSDTEYDEGVALYYQSGTREMYEWLRRQLR